MSLTLTTQSSQLDQYTFTSDIHKTQFLCFVDRFTTRRQTLPEYSTWTRAQLETDVLGMMLAQTESFRARGFMFMPRKQCHDDHNELFRTTQWPTVHHKAITASNTYLRCLLLGGHTPKSKKTFKLTCLFRHFDGGLDTYILSHPRCRAKCCKKEILNPLYYPRPFASVLPSSQMSCDITEQSHPHLQNYHAMTDHQKTLFLRFVDRFTAHRLSTPRYEGWTRDAVEMDVVYMLLAKSDWFATRGFTYMPPG
ncbi:hypothetical protein DFS34DRAFT_593479 [Phlyctochytrium arcticum]|nr:hypothetical protein DFS34DRAFT_593479 [Phlyctochytrium arcticum]